MNFPSEARAELPYSLGRFCDMVSTGSDEDNVSNIRYHNDINRTITNQREFVIQMSTFAIVNLLNENSTLLVRVCFHKRKENKE